jgi:hypothetical protein
MFAIEPAEFPALHPTGRGTLSIEGNATAALVALYAAWNNRAALPSVGTDGSAKLASALRSLVGVAAVHRGFLGFWKGVAAPGERKFPVPPSIVADEGRKGGALMAGKAHDLTTPTSHAGAFLGHFGFGFGLCDHLPG